MIEDLEMARADRNPYYVQAQECEHQEVRIMALSRALAEDPLNSFLMEELGTSVSERLAELDCPSAYFGAAVMCFFHGDPEGHVALGAMRQYMGEDTSYLPCGLSLLLRIPRDEFVDEHARSFFDACVDEVIDGPDVHPYLVEAAERFGVSDLEQRLVFARQRRRFR